MVDVAITLPNFVRDPAVALDIARRADATESIAAVFGYDHLFRVARDGTRRPAIECFALLSAVAASTHRVRLGALVARASMRPPAVLAANVATLGRIAGSRVVAGLGAGDGESRAENEAFGLGFGSVHERLDELASAVGAVVATGVETWVGGSAALVGACAARAGVWNRWGGDAERFASEVRGLRSSSPGLRVTWGGLVVLAGDDESAAARARRLGAPPSALVGSPRAVADRLRAYVHAGADTVVLAPVDSSVPDNVALVGAVADALG